MSLIVIWGLESLGLPLNMSLFLLLFSSSGPEIVKVLSCEDVFLGFSVLMTRFGHI